MIGSHLAAQLASDGSTPSGYQYYFIFHIVNNSIQINADRLSSQKILNLHRTDLLNLCFTIYKLVHTRYDL